MNEKEAEAQYKIISKMSLSEIVKLLRRGCDNPISPRNLTEEDTVVYDKSSEFRSGFRSEAIKQEVTQINRLHKGVGKALVEHEVKTLSFFMVRRIREADEGRAKKMSYWMFHIKFVGNQLFNDLSALTWDKIDRPTIIFNVNTGDKRICDWNHPCRSFAASLKLHSGSSSIFKAPNKIVIITPTTISDKFLNWNSNPFEVKR